MPVFNIKIPPTPAALLSKFLDMATFNILPMGKIMSKIFYMPPCQPLDLRFSAVGFQDSQFIANVGSIFLSIVAIPFLIIIAKIVEKLR